MLITAPDGGILNDPVMLRLDENTFWFALADSDVLPFAKGLAAHAGMDVKLSEAEAYPLQIQGPKSKDVVRDLFGEDILDLRYYHFRRLDLDGIPLILTRTGWTSEVGYEIYLLDASRGTDLWERIMEAGLPHEIRPTGPVDIRRIEGGIFNWGADMTYENNPFELGLDRLVDLDTEADFVAREALARIQRGGGEAEDRRPRDRRRSTGDERDDVAGLGRGRERKGDFCRLLAPPGEEHRLRVAAQSSTRNSGRVLRWRRPRAQGMRRS